MFTAGVGIRGWAVAVFGVAIAWLLGLIALAHRPSAWRLFACETAVLVVLVGAWLPHR